MAQIDGRQEQRAARERELVARRAARRSCGTAVPPRTPPGLTFAPRERPLVILGQGAFQQHVTPADLSPESRVESPESKVQGPKSADAATPKPGWLVWLYIAAAAGWLLGLLHAWEAFWRWVLPAGVGAVLAALIGYTHY